MVEKCYEFFGCKKTGCPMFMKGEDRNCWDVPDTACPIVEDGNKLDIAGDEKFFCRNCLYFSHITKLDS